MCRNVSYCQLKSHFPAISSVFLQFCFTSSLLLLYCIHPVNFKAWGKRSSSWFSAQPLPPSYLCFHPTQPAFVFFPSIPSSPPACDPLLLFLLALSSCRAVNSDAKYAKYNSFLIMRTEREGGIIRYSSEGKGVLEMVQLKGQKIQDNRRTW